MQARLDQLDLRGLELGIDDSLRLTLGAVVDVRGQLTVDGTRLAIDRASASRVEVAALSLHAGATKVDSSASIELTELRSTFVRGPAGIHCELQATQAVAAALRLTIGELAITGRLVLTNARLRLQPGGGAVFAEQAVFSELVLEQASSRLGVERLDGVHVGVEWGASGVSVRAATLRLDAPTLSVTRVPAATPTDPAVAPPPASDARPTGTLPDSLVAVLPLLDGLRGQLDVDLGLDLAVPVLGRRRATHSFRLPIEQGALDYLQLESGLSRLEDSLLDFSLREDGLVLERGVPLLPTRGLGKPIVRWDVTGDDYALAKQNRIRVAKLLQFRMASDDSGEPSPAKASDAGASGSSVALRELSFRPLVARLHVDHPAPPAALPLVRLGELTARADLHHAVETQPRDGTAEARILDVVLGSLKAVRTGSITFSLSGATLESLEAAGQFNGFHLRTLNGAVRGLQVTNLDLAVSAKDS